MKSVSFRKFFAATLSVAVVFTSTVHVDAKTRASDYLKPCKLNPAFVDYISGKNKNQDLSSILSSGALKFSDLLTGDSLEISKKSLDGSVPELLSSSSLRLGGTQLPGKTIGGFIPEPFRLGG